MHGPHPHPHIPTLYCAPSPPRAVQRRAGAKGFGLFAQEDLKAGQFVIEYLGEVLEEEEYHRRWVERGFLHILFMLFICFII